MKANKKWLAGIGAASTLLVGVNAPILEAGDMEFVYAYQYPTNETSILVRTATTTLRVRPTRGFSDDDGNGVVSVSVFRDSVGRNHKVQISDARYTAMGLKEGQRNNPTKTEYESVLRRVMGVDVAEAAWAFDNAEWDTGNSASSYTFSFTTGSLSAGLMHFAANFCNGESISSVAYNGTNATSHGAAIGDGVSVQMQDFYLVDPDSGTHNIVYTFSGTCGIDSAVATYSGIDPLDPVDAFDANWDGTTTNTNTYSNSFTTGADDTLAVWHLDNFSGDTTFSGTSGTTVRAAYSGGAANFGVMLADKDAPTSGSITLNVQDDTGDGKADWYGNVMVSYNEGEEAAAAVVEDIVWFFPN